MELSNMSESFKLFYHFNETTIQIVKVRGCGTKRSFYLYLTFPISTTEAYLNNQRSYGVRIQNLGDL